MMELNSIMNSADVEMQKVVVAELIRLSPNERDVLNQFDLAACDERIHELVNFIKCPTRDALISYVLYQLTFLYQPNRPPPFRYLICIFTYSSHSRGQTHTAGIQHLVQSLPILNLVKVFNLIPQTLTKVLKIRWSPVESCQIPLQ
ncbi:hypothetical protein ILYODFUR_039226 [Ilyodon furcidens]|uniref:Uncharacterized protein n=1 Tax=Ilyodon furcidens TaxID=33524 RepID=A0ABV0TQJ4_9TELE